MSSCVLAAQFIDNNSFLALTEMATAAQEVWQLQFPCRQEMDNRLIRAKTGKMTLIPNWLIYFFQYCKNKTKAIISALPAL